MLGRISGLGCAAVAAMVCGVLVTTASAASFGTGGNQFTLDFVPISGATNPTSGYGIVNYDYRIGKFEVTNAQWDAFVAAAGAPTGNPSSAYDQDFYAYNPALTTDVPTNSVSWYEAAQFANWLNTSSGHHPAYKFTGTQGTSDYTFDTWASAEAWGGTNLYRHKDAFYFLPDEDEWVKAAYWNGTALQHDAAKPGDNLQQGDGVSGTGWNYRVLEGYATNPEGTWNVGSGSEELNGTYDMMGNVFEWMESPYDDPSYGASSYRGLRSGAWNYYGNTLLSSYRTIYDETYESYAIGFRVASVIPSPASLPAGLSLLVIGGLATIRRRR